MTILVLLTLLSSAFSIKLGVYIQDESAEYGNMSIRSVRVKGITRNSIASIFLETGDFILSIDFKFQDTITAQTVGNPSGNKISKDDYNIHYTSKQLSTASAMSFINKYGLLDTQKLVSRLNSAKYGQNFEMIILRDGRFKYYAVKYKHR